MRTPMDILRAAVDQVATKEDVQGVVVFVLHKDGSADMTYSEGMITRDVIGAIEQGKILLAMKGYIR